MSKRKLLLADDSITIQKVVNLTFADEGIDVITVGDGDSAMAKISESAPDVILADVHMPGLSGYQVCEMVRANEATRLLPVVLLVGSFEPFDENEAARVGANAFLTKPFQSIRQLVSQVSDLMQASASVEEQIGAAPVEYAAPAVEPTDYAAPVAVPMDYGSPVEPASEYGAPSDDIDRTVPARVPDISDIDRLYAQSVGGPAAEEELGRATYIDAGMDDEMIETVHTAPEPVDEPAAEDFHQEPTAEYHQPTDDYQAEATGYAEPVADYQQPMEVADHSEPVAEFAQPLDNYEQPSAEYQEPSSQYAEPMPVAQYDQPVDAYREPVAEYHEPAQYEEPAATYQEEPARVASPFDAPAEVESNPIPLDQFSSTQGIEAPTTKEFALDDVNLLELPPMEGGHTIEIAPGADGSKQVVSLSPELMDALVEKVVKQLSKKE